MNIGEFNRCIQQIQKYFPYFELDDNWTQKWMRFCMSRNMDDFNLALDRWIEREDKAPTYSKFKPYMLEASNRTISQFKTNDEVDAMLDSDPNVQAFRRTSKIEFCMDCFGPSFVTAEIKGMVGYSGSWFDLCNDPDWNSKYKAKLEEMFENAKGLNPDKYAKRFNDAPSAQDRRAA